MAALRWLPRYHHRGVPFRGWLYRIATNTANRWARRRPRHEALHADRPAVLTVDSPERSDLRERARRALLAMPPKYQAVLALHYLEGLSVDEVAAILGCRAGTVKSRLSRAREQLRARL